MLYEYLTTNYKPNEPIFLTDVKLPSVNDNTLRAMFKKLCDTGKLRRFDNGVYYLPSESRLKGSTGLTPEVVASYKYIERGGKIDGYYTGFTICLASPRRFPTPWRSFQTMPAGTTELSLWLAGRLPSGVPGRK